MGSDYVDIGTRPLVSIVVPSRTGRIDGLGEQISHQSLLRTYVGCELVVQQGTAPAGRARNLAAARARGEILIFLDDDVHLAHGSLLADMVGALQGIETFSAVAVDWRLPPDATPFQQWQVQDSFDRQPDKHAVREERLVPVPWYVLGASCFAIRRCTFEALGGFDESLISGEDPEFWYRLSVAGGKPYLLSDRWIHHYPPRTLTVLLRKTIWYEQGNAQVMRKHPGSGYRMVLKSRWHAAWYLAARTIALVPLMFVKVSYRYRRPMLAFRPMAALLSYIGAWAYCLSWFADIHSAQATAASPTHPAEDRPIPMHPQQVLR